MPREVRTSNGNVLTNKEIVTIRMVNKGEINCDVCLSEILDKIGHCGETIFTFCEIKKIVVGVVCW